MIALYQPLGSMTLCFWQAVLLGAALGVLYDMLHAAEGKRPAWQMGVCDALFWLAALAAYFVFTVTFAGGQVRGFVLIGMLCGALGTHLLLGWLVRAITRSVWSILRLVVRGGVRLMRILGHPVCWLGQLVQKNLEKIKKRASISDKKKL